MPLDPPLTADRWFALSLGHGVTEALGHRAGSAQAVFALAATGIDAGKGWILETAGISSNGDANYLRASLGWLHLAGPAALDILIKKELQLRGTIGTFDDDRYVERQFMEDAC